MRPLLIAFTLLVAHPVYAQLAPHNEMGVTFGHVHLSVADPKLHHQMWVEQFGGVVSTKGTFTIVKLPNMMIAFRGTKPTGGTENTALNHFGLKVPNLAGALKKWRDAGYTVEREFKGSEGFPNAFLIGPDGLDAYYALIRRFDEALDASVANDYLTAALRTVRTHLVRVRRLARDNPDRLAASVAEHRLIASAIAARDADLAAHATHVHLHNALTNILESLTEGRS